MTQETAQQSAQHIRFKGRSFPVLTLEPEGPVDGWIAQLDSLLEKSPGFFARKSIVIDAARLELQQSGLTDLVEKLNKRGIRMMGIAGVDMAWASDDLPPILSRGRVIEAPFETANENADETRAQTPANAGANAASGETVKSGSEARADDGAKPASDDKEATEAKDSDKDANEAKDAKDARKVSAPRPLIVSEPVRSGQSIYHPDGDVTVIGSVSSGAEILAGGSVHIYGALRGRVMAGAYGEKNARIFCRKLEAELISVCGVYLTAEEISPNMQGQPIQAWLDDETVKIARLD